MISIIVPAHDEANVIARCLTLLREGLPADEAEILVVCNGCRDATAVRAREADPSARVLETPRASKIHALQLGDAAARGFPRFYVDADVRMPGASVRAVAAALSGGRTLAAAPRMRVDLAGCSWPVRAFYQVWLSLPYHADGMIGSGVYALSEAGRARFEQFPDDLIADDAFVHAHFAADERRTVESAWFEIKAPLRIASVLKVKTRSHKGLLQLAERHPELALRHATGRASSLAALARRPGRWPAALVYFAVMQVARRRARALQRRGEVLATWERDESSRAEPGS